LFVGQFLVNVGQRDLFVGKQINLLEIMVVLLLLLLLLLVVDLEVETSRTPLLWTHTSSNSPNATTFVFFKEHRNEALGTFNGICALGGLFWLVWASVSHSQAVM